MQTAPYSTPHLPYFYWNPKSDCTIYSIRKLWPDMQDLVFECKQAMHSPVSSGPWVSSKMSTSLLLHLLVLPFCVSSNPPNIILINMDDMGWVTRNKSEKNLYWEKLEEQNSFEGREPFKKHHFLAKNVISQNIGPFQLNFGSDDYIWPYFHRYNLFFFLQ